MYSYVSLTLFKEYSMLPFSFMVNFPVILNLIVAHCYASYFIIITAPCFYAEKAQLSLSLYTYISLCPSFSLFLSIAHGSSVLTCLFRQPVTISKYCLTQGVHIPDRGVHRFLKGGVQFSCTICWQLQV